MSYNQFDSETAKYFLTKTAIVDYTVANGWGVTILNHKENNKNVFRKLFESKEKAIEEFQIITEESTEKT